MNPPILLLYPEIVSHIALYLDIYSLKRLGIAGNARLVALLKLGVRNIFTPKYMMFLDLKAIFALSDGYKCIEIVKIRPVRDTTPAKIPAEALELPHTITELNVRFPGSVSLFLDNSLIKQLPRLRRLRLSSGETSRKATLSGIQFPSQLESLELFARPGELRYAKGDIDCLPKGLITLALPLPEEGLPQFDKYEWPLSLTHFELDTSYNQSILIELLPRTVSKLICWNVPNWKTTFNSQETLSEISFPWRSFFPHLSHLQLEALDPSFNSDLLKTLLLHDALPKPLVDDFIKNSYWNLPSLQAGELTYAKFISLWIPSPYAGVSLDNVKAEFQLLVPFLAETNLWLYPELPMELFKHTPRVKSTTINADSTETTQFSVSLEELTCNSCKVHLSILPKGLRSIYCSGFMEINEDGTIIEGLEKHIKIPPTLTSLHCIESRLPDLFIHELPRNLTKLRIMLGNPDQWDLVATRLSGLVSLIANFDANWVCDSSRTLALLTSKSIIAVTLAQELTSTPSKVPWSEFLHNCSSGTSPLPPTITKLSIVSNTDTIPIDAALALPKGLVALLLDGINWFPSTETSAHYNPTGLSIEEILLRLPPKIRKLGLNCSKGAKKVDFKLVKAFSPLVVYLSLQHSFESQLEAGETTTDEIERCISHLPPHLNYLEVGNLRTAYCQNRELLFSNP